MNGNRNNDRVSPGVVIATVILIALFLGLIVFFTSFILKNSVFSGIDKETETESVKETESETETEKETEKESETETEAETEKEQLNLSYKTMDLPTGDIYKGDLILVNGSHAFNFEGTSAFITLYGNKSNNYLLASSNTKAAPRAINHLNDMLNDFFAASGRSDVIVRAAYRSFDEQKALYDKAYEKYGEEAVSQVSLPGCSDHNTGLSFDLSVYHSDGSTYPLDRFEEHSWIMKNCHKYGFILRFPANKASITGISTDPFHFRYVGAPHAYYIQQNGLCLEEYTELLKQYNFTGEHLMIDDPDGGSYEVYYVAANKDNETQTVAVPENCDYSISGNNYDGFIIAVKLS